MTNSNLKKLFKSLHKQKQNIFFIGIILIWAAVILLKQGGQSLLVHYLWPFIVFGGFVVLMRKSWIKNKPDPFQIATLLALAIFLLTFITDQTPSDGSLELMNIGGGLLLALVLSQEKLDKKTINILLFGFLAVVSLIDIWGIISYSVGHPFNRLVGPLIKPNEAFAGFPNLLANLNLLVIVPAFYFFAEQKKLLQKLGLFLLNLLVIASLVLTYSRGAWFSAGIVIAVASIVFLIKYRKEKKKSLNYILKACAVLLISMLIVAFSNGVRGLNSQTVGLQEKLTFQSEDEGSSINERIASIERGIEMGLKHPVTGVGAGSFNYISQSYEKNFETLSSYPYSLPVKIFAEHGIIFFVVLFTLIITIVIVSFRTGESYIYIPLLSLCMISLHHAFDNNFDFFAASLPFFILLGVIWPENKSKKKYLNNYFILAIVLIFSLVGIGFAAHEAYYGLSYIKGRNSAGAGDFENGYNYYSDAENLIFKRDSRMASAISAFEIYKSTQDEEWLDKSYKKIERYSVADNPLDKRGPLLIAQIHLVQKNYSNCIHYARNAKLVGGENDFEADYYELVCLDELGEIEEKDNLEKNLKHKLEKYLELLKINAHMTVLTDNPKYAVYILDYLREYNIKDYETLYEDMFNTAKDELNKFHTKYGIDAQVEF